MIDAASRNFPTASEATTITARRRETSTLKRVEIQAGQTEALVLRHQAQQSTSQAVINAQGQLTGTLINIVA